MMSIAQRTGRSTVATFASRLAKARALPFAVRLLPILLLATVLSLFRLSAPDFWLDEGISYWIASKPLPEIVTYSLGRAWEHPPVYYIVLHGWMGLVGDSEFALRALSWGGMLVAASVIAVLGRRWFGDRVALLAALIVVTNPMVVKMARDVRMYAWLMALAPLSAYLLDRAISRNRWRDWGFFLAVVTLGIGTHYLFGLLVLSYALFLIIRWRQLPASRSRFALVLGAFFGTGLVALWALPGLSTNVVEGFGILLRTSRNPEWLWDLLREWAAGANFRSLPLVATIPIVAMVWGLAAAGVVWAKPLAQRKELDLRWFLSLLIFLPPAIGVLMMPTSTPRQTSASVPVLLLAVTVGLVAVIQRVRWLGIGLAAGLLGTSLGLSTVYVAVAERPFADQLDYVNARAVEGEPLVYTYYFDWPLDSYYNRRNLPYFNVVPERHQEVSEAVIGERAAGVMASGAPSLWLMLFPGPDNTDRAERAFNALAFPGERIWFPSGRSVIRYFAPRPLTEQPGGLKWGDQIGLARWGVDTHAVPAGDALRLQFQWQRLLPIDRGHLFALTLVGPDGSIWASQASVPCNGRCPTDAWLDEAVTDSLAFYVPPDVPPGHYGLHAAWLTPEGAPLVGRDSRDTAGRVDLPLMVVRVDPPAGTAPATPILNRPIRATLREGLTLCSVEFDDPIVRGGTVLAIPLQLSVAAPQPDLEVELWLARGRDGVTVAQPLAPAWHPSTVWAPGRTLRMQPRFVLPGALPPGEYRASLQVAVPGSGVGGPAVSIGSVVVEDRPRRFDLPEQGIVLTAACDQGISLVRFEPPQQALPGSTVPMTLTWQAAGPAQRSWKVYIHVRDALGTTVAQADGYPASGTALTSSWMPGEVVVDVHQLFLPADLPVGDYAVRVGLYDEATFERLRCGDDDGVTLPVPLRLGGQ